MKSKESHDVIRHAKEAMRRADEAGHGGWWLFTLGAVVLPTAILTALAFSRKPEVVAVTSAEGLVPYRQIRGADVALAHTPAHPGTASRLDDVIGRFALKTMKKGDIVEVASLSGSGAGVNWNGTQTISVPVKPLPKGFPNTFPQKITLLGAPKTKDEVTFKTDAILLGVDDSKESWAKIALPAEKLEGLLQVVSTHDLYVVQQLK